MPGTRRTGTPLVVPALLALILLGTTLTASAAPVRPNPGRVLPLLVSQGGAPGAAFLVRQDDPPDDPVPASALASEPASRYGSAGRGIARADHFRAGSITKTFIATVVLQLAAERRLALSDPVEKHLPGLLRVPGSAHDGRNVTLHHLLTHTSGLADYTEVTRGLVPVSPRGAVRLALTRAPSPAGRYAYSNTNYVLLGLVIEQVTGRSYAAEARRRIIGPLRLRHTSFPGARSRLPQPHGRAYSADGSDVTELDPRVAGAAGELVTTLADLDRFYAALLAGRLLPHRQLRAMLDTRWTDGSYGMGMFPSRLACGVTVWGHNGRMTGSYVRAAGVLGGHQVLTFRVDTTTIEGTALEPALLEAEFCAGRPGHV